MALAESGNRRREEAALLAARQPERPIQAWIRIHLGDERMIDIARAWAYGDGSAITQILKRLEKRAESNLAISRRLSRIEAEFNRTMSCVDPFRAICTYANKYNFLMIRFLLVVQHIHGRDWSLR